MPKLRRSIAAAACCAISGVAVLSCTAVEDATTAADTSDDDAAAPRGVLGTTTERRPTELADPEPATTTRPSITSSTATTSTTVDTSLRVIDIRTEPVDAEIVLSAAGRTRTVTSPWKGPVHGPRLSLKVNAEGFEPHSEIIDLGQPDRDLTPITVPTIELDPEGQLLDKLVEFDVGPGPKQVAFSPDGSELWVTLLGGTGVHVHDPVTGERIKAIELPGGGSVEVVFTSDGERAYVSQMETAVVYEIDVQNHDVLRRLETGSNWTKIVLLSADERRLFASNWVGNEVTEIDLETGEVIRQIRTVRTPRGLHLSADETALVVAGFDRGELQIIDLETGEGEIVHRSGGSARHLVGDGAVAYLSDLTQGVIRRIDIETGEVTELAEVDNKPNTIDLSPDGRVLFVSNRGANNRTSYYLPGPEWGSVVAIDTETGRHLDAIVGGNQTTGLDVSADGTRLAFSDFLDDRVTVVAVPSTAALLAGDGGRWGTHRPHLAK